MGASWNCWEKLHAQNGWNVGQWKVAWVEKSGTVRQSAWLEKSEKSGNGWKVKVGMLESQQVGMDGMWKGQKVGNGWNCEGQNGELAWWNVAWVEVGNVGRSDSQKVGPSEGWNVGQWKSDGRTRKKVGKVGKSEGQTGRTVGQFKSKSDWSVARGSDANRGAERGEGWREGFDLGSRKA